MLNVFCLMKRTKLLTHLWKRNIFSSHLKFKMWLHKPKMYSWKDLQLCGACREANIGDWCIDGCWYWLVVTVRLHDIGAFHSWSLRFWMYCIISVIRLQISGQQERAAAVALFNNKIREAIKILSSDRLRDNSMGGTGKKDAFNPLSPSIHIQILQTDLHTFP